MNKAEKKIVEDLADRISVQVSRIMEADPKLSFSHLYLALVMLSKAVVKSVVSPRVAR